VPGTRQSSAVGKINSLPEAGTWQNMTVGKADWREGGHLPSAFAGCHAVRHPTKIFYFFFKKSLCRVLFLALGKLIWFFSFLALFFWGALIQ